MNLARVKHHYGQEGRGSTYGVFVCVCVCGTAELNFLFSAASKPTWNDRTLKMATYLQYWSYEYAILHIQSAKVFMRGA